MVLGQFPSQPPVEAVLYQVAGDEVTVTTSRFIVGGTMYPVRNITAVQLIRGEPSRARAWAALLGVPFSMWVMGKPGLEMVGLVLLAVSFLAAMVLYVTATGLLVVRMATAGGQVDAVTTSNEERAKAIVGALHRATVG